MFFTLGSRGQTRDKLSIQHHNFITLPNMLLKKREKNTCKKLQIFHQIQNKIEEKKYFLPMLYYVS